MPVEVLRFGVSRTLARARATRACGTSAASPDGNLIADYPGPVEDPRALAERLGGTPGVVEHGLFAPEMVSEIFVAGADGVRRRAGGKPSA